MAKASTNKVVYDKPVALYMQDLETERWEPKLRLHAYITRVQGSTPDVAGAEAAVSYLTFRVRWCPPLEEVRRSVELCKLVFRGMEYELLDYDDYHEMHETVRLQVRGCGRASENG